MNIKTDLKIFLVLVFTIYGCRTGGQNSSAGSEAGDRLAGEAHPFVSKEAVSRYNRILLECYEAQLAWRTGS